MTKQGRKSRAWLAAVGLMITTWACGPAVVRPSQGFDVADRGETPAADVQAEAAHVVDEAPEAASSSDVDDAEAQESAADDAPPEPAGRPRRVRNDELTPTLQKKAREIINAHWMKPPGTDIHFEMYGKRYSGRIERHYHEPGGKARPWGWHPGCSLLVEATS